MYLDTTHHSKKGFQETMLGDPRSSGMCQVPLLKNSNGSEYEDAVGKVPGVVKVGLDQAGPCLIHIMTILIGLVCSV